MNTTSHVVLWIAQGFLALFFLAGGAPKVLGRGLDDWTGFSDLPRAQVILVGVAPPRVWCCPRRPGSCRGWPHWRQSGSLSSG